MESTYQNDMEIIDKLKKVYFLHLEHEVVMNIDYHMEENVLKFVVDTINSTTNSAWHFKTRYEYTVCPTGDILINIEGTPSGRVDLAPDMLPRIGVSMHLDKSMEHVRYLVWALVKTMPILKRQHKWVTKLLQ